MFITVKGPRFMDCYIVGSWINIIPTDGLSTLVARLSAGIMLTRDLQHHIANPSSPQMRTGGHEFFSAEASHEAPPSDGKQRECFGIAYN